MTTPRRDANHAAETLTAVAAHMAVVDRDGRTVLHRMIDAMAGQPRAQSYDSDRVSGLGASDPTATAALSGDVARADYDQLRRELRHAARSAERAMRILAVYTPRHPHEHERRETANANAPHCESCARIEINQGVAWWSEPLTVERTTVNGTLSDPMWLCRWCWEHVDERGCKPTEEELEQRRAGKRVRCPHPRIK